MGSSSAVECTYQLPSRMTRLNRRAKVDDFDSPFFEKGFWSGKRCVLAHDDPRNAKKKARAGALYKR